MLRQIAFAAALVVFSSLAVFAADPLATEAIQLDQTNALAYTSRGRAWGKKRDLDNAIKDFTEAIRIDPTLTNAFLRRGDFRYEKGDLDNAIKDFTEAIRLDPKFAPAYHNRGFFWGLKGDLDKAIKDYTEAIRLDPKLSSTYTNRGRAWSEKGDLDDAISDYTEAIRLDPKFAHAFTGRGNAWFKKGEPDNAISDYTEAIRLDPKNAVAYRKLAWVFGASPNADFRNGSKAVEYAKHACEISAWKDCYNLDALAAAYAEQGDFEEAIKWQEKAIELTTNEEEKAVLRTRIELYKEGKPYRDEPKK